MFKCEYPGRPQGILQERQICKTPGTYWMGQTRFVYVYDNYPG